MEAVANEFYTKKNLFLKFLITSMVKSLTAFLVKVIFVRK